MLSSNIFVAAAMATLTIAAPAPLTARSTGTFNMVATRSGSAVHLSSINAANGKFFVGKDTSSFCPAVVEPNCPPGNSTVLGASDAGTVSLSVTVPGGQQVYVAADGSLSFTTAHSGSIPDGAAVTGFNYTAAASGFDVGRLSFNDGSFLACPSTVVPDVYQIYASEGFMSANCTSISISTKEAPANAAWQYV